MVGMRVHLLDGTYELFRAFFGFPARQAPDGREVGAVLGILETTLSLLREPGVTHVAVATDTVIESFRNDLFPGYKTGEGVDQALLGQFPLAERAFRALGLVVWGMVEFEADDAIATAAARFAPSVEQVVIASPDKDLAQCVIGRHVVTWSRRTGDVLDEDGVRAKFGVPPGSIPDYLALVGDTADGVPGLPGWGAKSAATVLAEYHYLEEIPDDPSAWKVDVRAAAKLAAVLAERRQEALAYRELTTLRTDVPLAEDLADLAWGGVRREEFESLCDELGFETVRDRPHRWRD
jgi:5'-3' exonuclease